MSHNTDAQNQANRGMSSQIRMETTHYGIRIAMPVSPDEESLLELLARIPSDAYHLPEGDSIAFDFRDRVCSSTLLVRLLNEVVWDKQLRVAAWLSSSEESRRLFRSAGLVVTEPSDPSGSDDLPRDEATRQDHAGQVDEERREIAEARDSGLPEPDAHAALDRFDSFDSFDGTEGLAEEFNDVDEFNRFAEEYEAYDGNVESDKLDVFYTSLRSGQHVESPGNVVLWGHLNSGAEITAGGSVVVAGRLHGLVHAGCDGRKDVDVFIQAGAFEATQVRLGRKIGYADASTPGWGKPVLITVEEDGALTIRENTFLKLPPPVQGAWTPVPESR